MSNNMILMKMLVLYA